MTIIVGTNSYVSESELTDYATARGIILDGAPDVALIKAMDWLSIQPWTGERTDPAQTLDFPRNGSTDVPTAVKMSQLYLAVRADSGVDLLAPSPLEIKREKVDVIETEYATGTNTALYQTGELPYIKTMLAPYLTSDYYGIGSFRVKRG